MTNTFSNPAYRQKFEGGKPSFPSAFEYNRPVSRQCVNNRILKGAFQLIMIGMKVNPEKIMPKILRKISGFIDRPSKR